MAGEMEDSVLRKVQLTEFGILRDVKKLCDKYHIRYYLSSGTLLGAVRHKGFIPWDDDIDICMPYEDYKRFIKIARKQLPNDYFLQNSFTDINFQRAHAKIRKNNTTYLEKGLRDYQIHQGIWIDIFPLVNIEKGLDYHFKKLLISISNYCQAENYVNSYRQAFEKKIGYGGLLILKLFYKLPLKYRVYLHKLLLGYVFNGKGDYLTEVWAGITRIHHRKVFESSAMLEFEGEHFSAPGDWNQYLTIMYGDYMQLPPESERTNHMPDIISFSEGDNKR